MVAGPIIIGAGPSGLAVAASLSRLSIPSMIIERSNDIADLWQHHTYDRLSLHLPKQLCQLPHLPFPPHFPTYPSKNDFLHYLHSYAHHFSLKPLFNHTVVSASFDASCSLWRVIATVSEPLSASGTSESLSETLSESGDSTVLPEVVEFMSRWLVVATGENAEPVTPEMKGREVFRGSVLHSSEYKNGIEYKDKKVLVVGCGNSGMEMCLDLCEHGAIPFLSVRTGVHVLPREILGTSTFKLAMKLMKWLPVRMVDKVLVMVAKLVIGDTEKYGLKRPQMGPLELKNLTGKTPVLDVGALSFIKDGTIKIVPEVESLTCNGAKFVDGRELTFESVLFATGYTNNVPSWLKLCSNGWKGENGLYFVGFTRRGLLGTRIEADKIAFDIAGNWKNKLQHY
ncbi:Indole-3-pyruvate monooxygenase protein [Dioscorea alata]|uniref:Indole-3-pyruvate monooxygenase protein n=1 Tax=Dioscorea alata TaxID=55571 RepID=A0ACB7TVM1_DIOAL|nr:Indole-3-pyruvate monooxygenase protein [Dioscorea alata]